MIIPIIVLLLVAQVPPQQQVQQQEQQLEQQRQQLDRLQRQTDALAVDLNRTQQLLINELKPACSTEARWEPFSGNQEWSVGADRPVQASLLSIVSTPADACLPAEIRVTATYLQGSGFVCSGSVSVSQTSSSQNTVFEFRPFELELFVKWRDRPTWDQSSFHRLICFDRDGVEVRDPALRASRLKIYATVFGRRGGISTSEFQFQLVRPREDSFPSQVPRGFGPF